MPPSAPIIRRATPNDLPALAALLNLYYREGDVHYTEDEHSLRAYLHQHPYGFFLAEHALTPTLPPTRRLRPLPPPPLHPPRRRVQAPLRPPRSTAATTSPHSSWTPSKHTARASNLRYIYLDSKDNFPTAIAMYRRRGYTDCPRYNQNPEATIFLRKDLGS